MLIRTIVPDERQEVGGHVLGAVVVGGQRGPRYFLIERVALVGHASVVHQHVQPCAQQIKYK